MSLTALLLLLCLCSSAASAATISSGKLGSTSFCGDKSIFGTGDFSIVEFQVSGHDSSHVFDGVNGPQFYYTKTNGDRINPCSGFEPATNGCVDRTGKANACSCRHVRSGVYRLSFNKTAEEAISKQPVFMTWPGVGGADDLQSEVFTFPEFKDSCYHVVDVKLLVEDSNPDARARRAADSNLPDHLNFQVPLAKGEVTLHMKRSKLLRTVTSHADITNPISQNAGVYTDLENGAAMIVREQAGDFTLEGSFENEQTEWRLQPVQRSGQETGRDARHKLSAIPAPDLETMSSLIYPTGNQESPRRLVDRNRLKRLRAKQQQGQGSTININQPEFTDRQPGRKGNRRTKREAVQHTIEMVFVVDYADYEKWVNYVGASDAITEMTLYYTYVAEAIDCRFESISDPDIALRTVTKLLRILTSDSDDDFIEDLTSGGTFDGPAGLSAFRTWYLDSSNNIPETDHYMLFTGFDIRQAVGAAASGGTMCTDRSSSITENDFQAGYVGLLGAYYLGGSLGAVYDSQTTCSDSSQYVMSSALSLPIASSNTGNPWTFSPCSIEAFKTYLATQTCTEPQNTCNDDVLPAATGSSRGGVRYSRDDQCRLHFRDSSSSFCFRDQQSEEGGESALCGGMLCYDWANFGSCSYILPLEYTDCGPGKWCRSGACVEGSDTSVVLVPAQPGLLCLLSLLALLLATSSAA